MMYKKILVFSDIHAPAMHQDTVKFLEQVVRTIGKPDLVVCNGDLLDLHACSRWERDRFLPDAPFELEHAIESLKPLFDAFPKVSMTWGNHDLRVMKKAAHIGLSPRFMVGFLEALGAPKKWSLCQTLTVETALGSVMFTHDAGSKILEKAVSFTGISLVQGHYHKNFSLRYIQRGHDLLYGMTTGCLVDHTHPAFSYTKTSSGMERLATSVLGCGVIINGIPRLIPMVVNKENRWIGEVL